MNRIRRTAFASLGLLLLVSLAACDVPLPGHPLLSDPPSASVSSPVAAIEADGTRHFAWSTPGPIGQGITYLRVTPGGTLPPVTWYPADFFYNYGSPQLAVTTSGTAYVVYQSCPVNPMQACTTEYRTFARDWNGAAPLAQSSVTGVSGRTLVSRGSWIYLLGGYRDNWFLPTSSTITYTQLAGGTRHGIVAYEEKWFADTPSAAIDSAGNLHVAFLSYQLNPSSYRVGYTSDNGTGGDFPTPVYTGITTSLISAPSFSLSENNGNLYAAVAYAVKTAPSYSLNVWKVRPAPVADPTPIPLDFASGWQVFGVPALTVTGSGSYQLLFSASNSGSADSEMWLYKGSGAVVQLTDDAVHEGQPLAVKLTAYTMGSLVEYPVFAWRTASNPDPMAADNCFGDVRVLTEIQSPQPPVRTTFHDQGICSNYGYDLAAGGTRVLGVWLDVRSGSSVLEPWYSVNGTETFIPTIRR